MGEMWKIEILRVVGDETVTATDLFDYQRFDDLEEALKRMAAKEGDDHKPGLKLSLGYLLQKAASILKVQRIINGVIDKAEEVDHFLCVLKLNWDSIFYCSQVAIEKGRQLNLRKPKNLPLEEDVAKLKLYTVQSMNKMTADPFSLLDSHDFKELSSLIVSRLTLFNARRGGEPARLTLKEWEDAENGSWIDPQLIETVNDPLEKQLLGSFKLAYQAGKGSKKLVPVLIPPDTIEAIRKLVSIRQEAGVSSENKYLFPYTQKSTGRMNFQVCQPKD